MVIQSVVEKDLVLRLLELFNTTQDSFVRSNLADVIVRLAAGKSWQIDMMMQGGFSCMFVSALLEPFDWPDESVAEKAVFAVGKIADMSPDYRDLFVQAGTLKPLLRLLTKHSEALSMLRASSYTLMNFCDAKFDFRIAEVALKAIVQLLANDDTAVLFNSTRAMSCILEGLAGDELKSVINARFIRSLLGVLPRASPSVQHSVLKCIYLIISRTREEGVKMISLCGGVACLSKISSSQMKQLLSITDEAIQKLAVCSISKIVTGNKGRLQVAINNGVVQTLIQIILAGERNRNHALWTLYLATKAGSGLQIKYLVRCNFIKVFCGLITDDSTNVSGIALWALQNVSSYANNMHAFFATFHCTGERERSRRPCIFLATCARRRLSTSTNYCSRPARAKASSSRLNFRLNRHKQNFARDSSLTWKWLLLQMKYT